MSTIRSTIFSTSTSCSENKACSQVNFPFFIARRYLFAHKRRHAINIISAVAVAGVAFATIAMVCTLSVFNGFQDLVASLFTAFDPELKVVPAEGKTIAADDPAVTAVKKSPLVYAATECVEGLALARYLGNQTVVTVKGVDSNWPVTSDLSSILYGDGDFALKAADLNYGTPGIQLAQQLQLGVRYTAPLEIYAPRKGERIEAANPAQSFNYDQLYSPGVVFSVKQKKYDANYIITSIEFARSVFEKQGCISSLELKLKSGTDIASAQKEIAKLCGGKLKVQNRYEQQEDVFRIMRIEKLVAYLFLTFILIVACFNIVGSLSMLIIDKRDDMRTLRFLGAGNSTVARIFLHEGRLVALTGVVAGIVVGVALCMAQQHFGLIKMGDNAGTFIVNSYPVSVRWNDVLLTFVTVIVAGYVTTWYPVRYLSKKLL